MIAETAKKITSLGLTMLLIVVTGPAAYGSQAPPPQTNPSAQAPPQAPPEGGGAADANQPAPHTPEQIQALVAPIALYPDPLVAQVLSASTFPDQVALAQNWVLEHKNLSGDKLMKEVDKQDWDPSVKALAAFPSVLDNMAKNLAWTSELGEVYHFQAKDVMEAVQALRAKAKAEGHLQTTPQITVVQQSPSTIVIEPANPQVVYVPQYNPTVIFGTPYVVPGYTYVAGPTTGEVVAASAISFGTGIAIGALMAGGCCHTWGWSTWNVNWHGGYVGYAGHPYYGSAAWHGASGAYGYHGYGYGGGAAAYHGAYGSAGAYHGTSANGVYHQGGAYSNASGGASRNTSYAPNGAVHTSGSGYSNASGQSYHYGASKTAAGGTVAHGTTSTGQHYAGGTTASGQHWGGTSNSWAHNDGWSSRAASDRGNSSMHGGGGFHGGRR